MRCTGSFDGTHTILLALVHGKDNRVMLIQFSGEYVPGSGKLSERDNSTAITMLGGVVGVVPNVAEIDFANVRKLIFGDAARLVTTGVRKTIGRAILVATLANGKLTFTVAVDPEQMTGGLTAEMLHHVLNQDLRFFHMQQ